MDVVARTVGKVGPSEGGRGTQDHGREGGRRDTLDSGHRVEETPVRSHSHRQTASLTPLEETYSLIVPGCSWTVPVGLVVRLESEEGGGKDRHGATEEERPGIKR